MAEMNKKGLGHQQKTVKTYQNSPFHKRKKCQDQFYQNSEINQRLEAAAI